MSFHGAIAAITAVYLAVLITFWLNAGPTVMMLGYVVQ